MQVTRLSNQPIIGPHMDARIGDNINGPSLIRAPAWLEQPLAAYYLYFAHHDGRYIRLALADDLSGPWLTYEPGVLPLQDSLFSGHIASPDVHVDDQRREIQLYYHRAYFRVFRHAGCFYALAMPGIFYRSPDGLTNFELGPALFSDRMRHTAVRIRGDSLSVFYSNAGDCPERILLSTIEFSDAGRTFLLYVVAGERGIAMAQLQEHPGLRSIAC